MGDVNSIIAAPYQPNMQSNMQALSEGNALLNAFDAQSAAKEAGPMAAAGDWEGARNSLLGAGQIDQAAKVSEFQQALQDRARKMSDEKLSDAAKTWGLVGNGAVYADTPEKYSTLLSVLSKNGIDVSPYKDFTTGRQAALALSGQAKTILDQEKAARDEFRSNISGGLVREATNKDFNGNETSGYAQIGPLPGGRIAYTYTPAPEGLDIGESLGGKAAKTTDKDAALNAAIQEAKDGFAAKYPDKPKLSDALARVAGVQALKGVPTVDWKFDNAGVPSEPVFARKESSSYQAQLEAKISDEAKRDFGETPPATVVHEAAANKATRIVLDENGRWKPEYTEKPAKSAVQDRIDKAIPGVKALYARDNPGKPELDDAIARSIAAQTVKGKEVTGWEHNPGGLATGATYKEGQSNAYQAQLERKIAADAKTEFGQEPPATAVHDAAANKASRLVLGENGQWKPIYSEGGLQDYRQKQIALKEKQSDLSYQFALARAKKSGANQGNIDSRASIVVGALNHFAMVDKELDKPEVNSAIGKIHGSPTYQAYRGMLIPWSVETPAEFGRLRQDLESAQAEVERIYTSGQGVVTDNERKALHGIVIAIKDAPNAQVAKSMVRNARELIGGLLETPTIQDVQNDPTLAVARAQGLKKVEELIQETNHIAPQSSRSVPQSGQSPMLGASTPAAPASGGIGSQPAPATPTSTTAPIVTPALPSPKTKADFDSLPPNAEYIAPDGSRRRKP